MSQEVLLQHILNLPKEIQNEIYCFNPENRRIHKELLYCVHCELDDTVNWKICDNDMCEKEFYIFDEELEIKNRTIFGMDFTFCSPHCALYGSWSITYDLRKMRGSNPSPLIIPIGGRLVDLSY